MPFLTYEMINTIVLWANEDLEEAIRVCTELTKEPYWASEVYWDKLREFQGYFDDIEGMRIAIGEDFPGPNYRVRFLGRVRTVNYDPNELF